MSRIDTNTRAVGALRTELSAMRGLLEHDAVSLLDLGKAYAKVAEAMLAVALASERTSMRFEAAALALDLRTAKSRLRAFLAG